MKGITHFAVGVAIATFFPEVVQTAGSGGGFGPALAGVAGLLPDTLDFKFIRYLHKADVVVDPARAAFHDECAGMPDAQAMADTVAGAARRAHETGESVRVRLHTLQLGADRWQRWWVRFDADAVTVEVGPVVTTGQVPVEESAPPASLGSARLPVPVLGNYGQEIAIDIFAGPDVTFHPKGDVVAADFLPWHRAWTHSLLVALLVGALGWWIAPVYGVVMGLAVVAHVAVDQLGHMGSNLLAPITRQRTPGLRLLHSGDPLPNFLIVWTSAAVALLNLDRFSGGPVLPVWPYLIVAVAVPWAAAVGWKVWMRHQGKGCGRRGMLDVVDEAGVPDV